MDDTTDNSDEADAGPVEPAVFTRAKDRFENITSAVQEERMLALEDRRFASIAGAQWEGDWLAQFENSIRVEVNKTAQGVEKIERDYRANRITVVYRAVGGDSDEKTAETLNGMFRADMYASYGQEAVDNSFVEGINGGIGAWRLTNVYCDEFDPDNDDQRVAFEPIVDADQCVYFDMNSRRYNKSDAMFCFVITAMTKQAYIAEYGADKVSSWADPILKRYYDWFTPDVVRVAEYYEVEIKPAERWTFVNRLTSEEMKEWKTDLTDDDLQSLKAEGWDRVSVKRVKRRQIAKYVMSGAELLQDRKIIPGQYIPIIPYYGRRWFIDNMERSKGHVRNAKDPARIYNAQISKLVETSAVSPIARPIVTTTQIAGHESSWAEANINRAPYALINPTVDADGNEQPSGPVGMLSPPDIPPALVGLIQITASDIAEMTSSDDGADQTMSNVSADAMDIAATRTDDKSSIYMDNASTSMQWCGVVYQSMIAEIVTEGQIVETIDEEGADGTAVISEPHTDEKTGAFTFRNDISKGKYKVIADVTEATKTRRDKTVKTLVNVATVSAATDPELSSAALATAVHNMDGEGINEFKEWLRKRMVQQGLAKPTDEEKAEMAQAAQNAPPDPNAVLAEAQSKALLASAGKDLALTQKAGADTKLSEAKVVQTLADAHQKTVDAEQTRVDTQHAKAQGPFHDFLGKIAPGFLKPRTQAGG